jgi:hypothetical protein
MPKCQSCAANYDDNFRYCPYCSTAKPTPQIVVVQNQSDPRLYEEGVLRRKLAIETQIIGASKGWFGKINEERQPFLVQQFELVALSHERGEYVFLTSSQFRALLPENARYGDASGYLLPHIQMDYYEAPCRAVYDFVQNGEQYERGKWTESWTKLFETLFREQKNAWDGFCAALRSEGWYGITDRAIGRTLPYDQEMWTSVFADYPRNYLDKPPTGLYYDRNEWPWKAVKEYRYRRQL